MPNMILVAKQLVDLVKRMSYDTLQQRSKTIKPIDVSPADKGRKNEGLGADFRSRFTARFAYDSFDPNAKTKIMIYFQDGKMIDFDADLSKVK